MATINLKEPWTYRTPLVTIPFPAGTHEVADEVAEAFGGEMPDPLDGSIEELTEYLATVTDPAVIPTLIRNEKAGKTRKGALDALENRWAELTEDDDGDADQPAA